MEKGCIFYAKSFDLKCSIKTNLSDSFLLKREWNGENNENECRPFTG